MSEFLAALGTLSLGGSAAVCALALTARLSRAKYAARWRCWAWLILCIRLAIPAAIQLPERMEAQPPIQITVPGDTVLYPYVSERQPERPDAKLPQAGQPMIPAPDAESPVGSPPGAEEPGQRITLYGAVFAVWAVGAAGTVLWYMTAHLRFLGWLRRWGNPVVNGQTVRLYNALGDALELDRRPELLICTGLRVPVLVGLFRQKLLLPEGEMEEDALRYSLLHELTHFRRRDIWLKTLALTANAIHWFNPLMWYMTRLVERDTELACDEAALKTLPAGEHSAYGKTILDAVAKLRP